MPRNGPSGRQQHQQRHPHPPIHTAIVVVEDELIELLEPVRPLLEYAAWMADLVVCVV